MRLVKKILKITLIVLIVLAALSLFVWMNGVQYTLAITTGGFGKPYFDVAQFTAAPNCGGAEPCGSGPLRVMTYNVLCRICDKEDYDPWEVRVPHLKAMIDRYDPDLLGLQELGGQKDIDEFLRMLPQYACLSYEFGLWSYADAALFYRKDRFEALDSGQMWLNPKPTLPFGFGWKTLSMPRYVNWAYLKQKSNGFRFLYVNTHFDNNGANKEPSAVLFAETFRPIAAQMPIIVTGDFNTDSKAQRYQNIMKGKGEPVFSDTMSLASNTELVNNVPPGVKKEADLNEFISLPQTIDHVFVGGPLKCSVLRWVQDASVYPPDARWPSDHPAVFTEIVFDSPGGSAASQ